MSQEPEPITAPPPPPPPPVFYPPPPPPVAYSPPALPAPNPVELNGTTYFPIAQDNTISEEYHYPINAPIPVAPPPPAPMVAPVPIPVTAHFQYEQIIPPPLSPPPSYHYVPQVYPPHGENSFLEQAYINETSPLVSAVPAPVLIIGLEDMNLIHSDTVSVQHEGTPVPVSVPVPKLDSATASISAETNQENRRPKKRSNGHVRRISINVKTGEVVERTLEGRHGVYGL